MQKLYYGGDIITMVNETDAPEALVAEDGKILFAGDYAEAQKLCGAEAEKVDLQGNTLMPSFIDGHSHLSMYSRFSAFPDASGCGSFQEIADFVEKCIREKGLTEKDVLLVTGYDHNFLQEEAHPTRDILDKASGKVPVYLYHSSGHMGVINTAMMELAGLSEDAKDPEGGHYGRYEDGKFNGYLEELAAFAPVLMKVFERIPMDQAKQLSDVQDIYLKYGITTVQDGSTSPQVLEGFKQMAQAGLFRVDVVAYPMFNENPEKLYAANPAYAGKYSGHLKIAGSKIFLDGSPQGKSAWLSKPYEGEESYCGYPTQKDEVIVDAAKTAIKNGFQILAHCNGDAACGQYIRCYKKAMEELGSDGGDLRPVMIHCQTVRKDQLEEMAEIGMIPSIFVAHTYYWGDVHLKNLGKERGERISPVKTALELGLKYNFHQDCPVLAPDMMKTVWCAVNRITRKGVVIGEKERISVFDALKGVTVNAAYAYHEEADKGTLEPGKLANMIILEQNPLKTEPEKLADIAVLETIKEGMTLYRKEE